MSRYRKLTQRRFQSDRPVGFRQNFGASIFRTFSTVMFELKKEISDIFRREKIFRYDSLMARIFACKTMIYTKQIP